MDKLLDAAYNGVVKVTFSHYRTGEELTANLTLKATPTFIKQRNDSSCLAFYDVDDTRWQSIDVNTITNWEIVNETSG
jgi:hypothetical protein